MNVILTGGGTAGHVMPCLAIVSALRRHFDNVYYVGSKAGMERDLAKEAGLPYFAVPTVKLDRAHPVRNLSIPHRLSLGVKRARALIRKLQPSVVFAKGGYVSLPVALAARKEGVPVVIHESDCTMGLANRIIARHAALVLTAFPETAKKYNGICVGIPLREAFLCERQAKKAENERKSLLIMGGSLGASALNGLVFSIASELTKRYDVVHLTGKGKSNPSINVPHYRQIEFSSHVADLIRLSDVVLSRAGATTLFELAALSKPSVLVPLAGKATRGDQIVNARSFERRGYAVVLEESHMTESTLLSALCRAEQLSPKPLRPSSNSEIADLIASRANPTLWAKQERR